MSFTTGLKLLFFAGYICAPFVHAEEVSRCFSVNSDIVCYYADGSALSWDDAKEFCDSKNATLPIITDDDIDNAFHQLINGDLNSVMGDQSVWVGAHARSIDKTPSHFYGMFGT